MVKVAVLIPHYNNIQGLEKSLSSISALEPIDVVIVDDGSKTRPNLADLKSNFRHVNNFSIINIEKNMGIEYALNEGLSFIEKSQKYEYIARLDCGDICHPERFKIQREFLDKNSDIYLVGSWVSFVDTDGKELFPVKYPLKHKTLKKKMYFNNMFIHPSVMFRTSAIDKVGYYPTDIKNAEDYAYFFKFVKFFETANIDKILVKVELNPEGISISKRKLQIRNRIRIILQNWEWDVYCVYGLSRNVLIYFLPYFVVEKMKMFLSRIFKG